VKTASWLKVLCAFLAAVVSSAAAHALDLRAMPGKTYRTWDPSHGSQISYVGPRGLWAFLWYPGNDVVVPSRWQLASVAGQPGKCQLWPEGTHNPTRPGPGNVECSTQARWAGKVVEVANGDIFGLAHDPGRRYQVPFRLPREPLPFAQLKGMMAR
jgi:hypothetical protein